MSKNIKDTEFVCLSAILRAKEAKLLTREKLDRMLAEPRFADACRIAVESGYEDMSEMDVNQINEALARFRTNALTEINDIVPDESLLHLFQMQYGYHNAKVLVKSKGDLSACSYLMSDAGRFRPEELLAVYNSDWDDGLLPPVYAQAIRDAKQALARTNNPQLADFILDRAYFTEQLSEAEKSGKKYIVDCIRCRIDKANLRSTLRTLNMGRREDLLKYSLVEGGTISISEILESMETKDDLVSLYSATIFRKAAEAPNMTEFEKAADNAAKDFIQSSSFVAFGPEVVVEYISALENEIMSLRIILTGKLMGIGAETLRERLRESYV